jgi:hypothetical protein
MRSKVRDLKEAVSALRQARIQGCAVVLESPERVTELQGTAWFLALVREARQVEPDVQALALVDAGHAGGLALDAIMQGADIVRIAPGLKSAGRLKNIALAKGVRLEIEGKRS